MQASNTIVAEFANTVGPDAVSSGSILFVFQSLSFHT